MDSTTSHTALAVSSPDTPPTQNACVRCSSTPSKCASAVRTSEATAARSSCISPPLTSYVILLASLVELICAAEKCSGPSSVNFKILSYPLHIPLRWWGASTDDMPIHRSRGRSACGSMHQHRFGGKVLVNPGKHNLNVAGTKMQLNRYRHSGQYAPILKANAQEKMVQMIGGTDAGAGVVHSKAYSSGPALHTITGVSEAMPNQASKKEVQKRTLEMIRQSMEGDAGGRRKKKRARTEGEESKSDMSDGD